ncbi:MAG: coiled-coil domain-containing protein [Eggerthella lenta]
MSEHTIGLSRRTFLTGAAALGALSVLAPTTAFAETAAEKQAEADAVRNQLIGLQADLEAAEISYYSALDERDAAQKAMEDQQAKIDDANSQISDLQDKLGTRARNMYRNGSTSFVDFVLGAASFEEFTQNWDLLNKMNENDADMVDQTKTCAKSCRLPRTNSLAKSKSPRPRLRKPSRSKTTSRPRSTRLPSWSAPRCRSAGAPSAGAGCGGGHCGGGGCGRGRASAPGGAGGESRRRRWRR